MTFDPERVATAVLSGAYERRRGNLTAAIMTMNQIAVTSTLGIWAFAVDWAQARDPKVLALQVAWAGALASLLLGLWRFYARYLDKGIIRLYPILYLSERALLPPELCTVPTPQGVRLLSQADVKAGVAFQEVFNKAFGNRGHAFMDCLAAGGVALFAALSFYLGCASDLVTITWFGPPHPVGLLQLGNVGGISLVAVGWLRWRNGRQQWPVSISPQEQSHGAAQLGPLPASDLPQGS